MKSPYPLSDLPLDELIASAQAELADDSAAMAEILNRFSGDIAFVANTTVSDWHLRQDAAQGARMGLVKAVRNHSSGTNGFRSYARFYMKSQARRTAEAMTSIEVCRDPSILLEPTASGRPGVIRRCQEFTEEAPRFGIEDIITALTPGQQSILVDRYVHDRSMTRIASDLKISVPAVSQRLKTIHKALRPILLKEVAA